MIFASAKGRGPTVSMHQICPLLVKQVRVQADPPAEADPDRKGSGLRAALQRHRRNVFAGTRRAER